jgi:rifampicin phosphotransferase
MEQLEQQGPIPVPPEFPVTWESPDDERLFWARDTMHFPDQMNELEGELVTRVAHAHGFARASEAYEMPIRLQPRRINTYYYMAVAPVIVPPEETKAMEERAREKLEDAISRLGETWSGDYLPEIQEYLRDWDDFDLRSASMPELLSHLDETFTKFQRLWEIHFNLAFPMLMAVSIFEEFYSDLFNPEGAFDAYRLLQGLDNKTVESGRMLWQLSRRALEMPEVRKILEERAAADIVPALEGSAEGRQFFTEFEAYLDEYGHRGDKWG